jgi:hypothetical protein
MASKSMCMSQLASFEIFERSNGLAATGKRDSPVAKRIRIAFFMMFLSWLNFFLDVSTCLHHSHPNGYVYTGNNFHFGWVSFGTSVTGLT